MKKKILLSVVLLTLVLTVPAVGQEGELIVSGPEEYLDESSFSDIESPSGFDTDEAEDLMISEEIELTAGTEDVPETIRETDPSEEKLSLKQFVCRAFGSEEAAVTSQNEDGTILICGDYGVLFVEYGDPAEKTGGEKDISLSGICWNASSDSWTRIDQEGKLSVLEAGMYTFYGDTRWYIGARGCGTGGHYIEGNTWSYFLGNGDLASGYASKAGWDGFLPEAIYHGAEWTETDLAAKKGGYHSFGSDKYYCLKDGTILQNGTMKIGDRWCEFGEDGKLVRTYQNNYWKQERLGYYVRVDENGNIIRTQGFYEFDGNTYFLCGGSGRRVQGWFTFKGNTYYLDKETGILQTGFQVIDEVPYYFSTDPVDYGKMRKGAFFIDGVRYSFNYRNGKLITGWITGGTGGNRRYYVNKDGSFKSGWSRIAEENKTYYFEPTWCYALTGLQTIDGNLYLFLPDSGAVGRRWVVVDGNRYYCDPSTAIVTTGFATINGRNYVFDATGKMLQGSLPDTAINTLMENLGETLPQDNGEWSVYVCDLSTVTEASLYDHQMQAASLIKLFIMGAVYENYDVLCEKYGKDKIDEELYWMITISDNNSANVLIECLGYGDTDKGKAVVNSFCQEHGYTSSHLGRLVNQSARYDDNYTSVVDCGHFLKEVYYGRQGAAVPGLSHTEEMYNTLRQQQRLYKLPYYLPDDVIYAGKTGEINGVQNDTGIMCPASGGKDLVVCVMNQGNNSWDEAEETISEIGLFVYNFYNS